MSIHLFILMFICAYIDRCVLVYVYLDICVCVCECKMNIIYIDR